MKQVKTTLSGQPDELKHEEGSANSLSKEKENGLTSVLLPRKPTLRSEEGTLGVNESALDGGLVGHALAAAERGH